MRPKMVIFDLNSLAFGLNIVYKAIKNVLTPLDIQVSNNELIKARYGNVSTITRNYIRRNGNESIATNMVLDNSISVLNQTICGHIELGDITDKSGIKETMDMLKHSGYKIGVSSGFDSTVTDKLINELRFKSYVDSWISVDKVKLGKPYPYMIYTLMEDCQILTAEEVVKVVTSDTDVNVAINASCGLLFKDNELNIFQEEMLSSANYPFLDAKQLDFSQSDNNKRNFKNY